MLSQCLSCHDAQHSVCFLASLDTSPCPNALPLLTLNCSSIANSRVQSKGWIAHIVHWVVLQKANVTGDVKRLLLLPTPFRGISFCQHPPPPFPSYSQYECSVKGCFEHMTINTQGTHTNTIMTILISMLLRWHMLHRPYWLGWWMKPNKLHCRSFMACFHIVTHMSTSPIKEHVHTLLSPTQVASFAHAG